jgi:hypothetical protein
VDIRNGSGDPAVADELAATLAAAGIQVGTVTATDDATTSVLFPDGQVLPAGILATALGLTASAQVGAVDHVTVVIGADDFGLLVAAPFSC